MKRKTDARQGVPNTAVGLEITAEDFLVTIEDRQKEKEAKAQGLVDRKAARESKKAEKQAAAAVAAAAGGESGRSAAAGCATRYTAAQPTPGY
jgi:hypothetical protein